MDIKSVLVVAAHPDDEILGAGATMRRLKAEGTRVRVMIASSISPTREKDLEENCKKSLAAIGVDDYRLYSFHCLEFDKDSHHEMVKCIEDEIRESNPDTVIIHHPADIHPDHKTLALCALEAVRLPQRQIQAAGSVTGIKRVMCMEVPSSTDWSGNVGMNLFAPSCYVEVSEADIDAKIKALEPYDGAIREMPHPRSREAIKALATMRGAQFGVKMAEAFQTIFERVC